MHDFEVESSPEPQPTASTSAASPSAAPLPRRSGRTSLEANSTAESQKPSAKQHSKSSTKSKPPPAATKRKSLLSNKRLRSEPEQDSADDEGEEETSFLDASKPQINPKPVLPPAPIKSALKSANPEKKSRGVAVIHFPPCFYSRPFAHLVLFSSREPQNYSTKPRPSIPTTWPINPTIPTPPSHSRLILLPPAPPSPLHPRRENEEQIPLNLPRLVRPKYVPLCPNSRNQQYRLNALQTSRTTNVRQPAISSPPANPQSTPGKISARRAGPPSQFDPKTDNSAPINTRETPIGMRNIAMRNGDSAGKSGSARRDSVDRRGKRGSSIGNGFTGQSAFFCTWNGCEGTTD